MSATATPAASPQAAAAATRKFKALVAYLVSSGTQDTSDPHPIVANATVAEFNRALEEANRKTRCPLSTTYQRWFGKEPFSLGVADVGFRPMREVRFKDMVRLDYRHGYTSYFYNQIEMVQVCYRQVVTIGKNMILFHIQSLVCGETPSYYRMEVGSNNRVVSCVRMLELPTKRFSVQRAAMGSISTEARDALLTHKKHEPADPILDDLLKQIATLRT
jgi:hypothetical protein